METGIYLLLSDGGAYRINAPHLMSSGVQDFGDEAHSGSLAVGARDADNLELARGEAVQRRVEIGESLTRVGHDGRGHALQLGEHPLDHTGHCAGLERRAHKVVSVHTYAGDGYEKVTGDDESRIADDMVNLQGAPVAQLRMGQRADQDVT